MQNERSRRTALILAAVAAAMFAGFVLRYWLFK
ncbi:MAG: cytochrome oxidase small assembly protein [Denitratisoma sp.]|nr:cytochrome oxidase small assembly protein [Denitratisoma sp.]